MRLTLLTIAAGDASCGPCRSRRRWRLHPRRDLEDTCVPMNAIPLISSTVETGHLRAPEGAGLCSDVEAVVL
jgi:hypothetical protein